MHGGLLVADYHDHFLADVEAASDDGRVATGELGDKRRMGLGGLGWWGS